jgi:hypothetical protein
MIKEKIKAHIVFVIVFVSAAILRFYPLFDYELTLDEISGLGRTGFTNFSDLIEHGVKLNDTHPALVQVIIFCVVKVFGYKIWLVKLPFLLFSLGSIIYFYKIGIEFFNKQVANFAIVINAFSLLFVFYAPIARMYSGGVFFSVALLYYALHLFYKKSSSFKFYLLFGLFAWLCALNQHLNMLFAFTVALSGLLFISKTNFKPYLLTCLAIVIAYLPHVPVTWSQLTEQGGIGLNSGGWVEKPEWIDLFKFIKILIGTGNSFIVVAAMAITSFFMLKKIEGLKITLYLFALFLANFLIIYTYSNLNSSVYQFYVMQFSGVALLIVISNFLQTPSLKWHYVCLIGLASTLLYKTYFGKSYFKQCVPTVFQYQYYNTQKIANEKGSSNITAIFFDSDLFMDSTFSKMYQCNFKRVITGDSGLTSILRFNQLIQTTQTNYIALTSSFPIHQHIVKEKFPYLIESTITQSINYKLYSKWPSDSLRQVKDELVLHHETAESQNQIKFPEYKYGTFIDSTIEFPYGVSVNLNKITSKEGQVVFSKFELQLNRTQPFRLISGISLNSIKNDSNLFYTDNKLDAFTIKQDSSVTMYCDYYCGTQYRKVKDQALLKAFLWNQGKSSFAIKKVEIYTIDFWQPKWNFWN